MLGFLLIVPGLFLLISYLVLVPVVLLEGQLNPVNALRRCVMLVGPNWWRVCAAFVIASLLGTIFVFAIVAFSAFLSILAKLLGRARARRIRGDHLPPVWSPSGR